MPSERAIETQNVRFFGLMIGKIEVFTPKSDRLLEGNPPCAEKNRMNGSPLTEFYSNAVGALPGAATVIMIMTFRVQLKLG
jgi:hypothetical protein